MANTSAPVALITGASSGVGAATAALLAKNGYNVLINYNRGQQDAEKVASICSAHGSDVVTAQGNVASDEDCKILVKRAIERWGRLDALVNNAAMTQFVSLQAFDLLNSEDFLRVFEVNLIGAFQMTRAAAPFLKVRDRGSIVNVSSIGSLTGNGSSYAYIASKAALNALTLALARSLSPGIRVNAVLPGMIEGRWLKDGLGDESYLATKKQFAESSALGKVCTPEEIADAIVWFLTGASAVTGQLLAVDSGALLGKPPSVQR